MHITDRLSGYAGIFTICSGIFYYLLHILHGISPLSDFGLATCCTGIFLLSCTITLNYLHYYTLAKGLFLLTLNGMTFILSSTYGYNSGKYIEYLNIIFLSLLLFYGTEKRILLLVLSLPVICLILLEITSYNLFRNWSVSALLQHDMYFFHVGMNLFVTLLLASYTLRNSARHQKALTDTHKQIQASLEADMRLTEDIMYGQVLKYSAIFEAVADGMIICNQHGVITEVNRAACQLLFRNAEHITGLPYQHLLNANDAHLVAEGRAHNDLAHQWESVLLRTDGTAVPVTITCVSFIYLGDIFKAVLLKDITERKKAESIIQTNREIENAINTYATSLYEQNSVEGILEDLAKYCLSTLEFVDCEVYVMDATDSNPVQHTSYGRRNRNNLQAVQSTAIAVGESMVEKVVQSGIAEIIEDTSQEPGYTVGKVKGKSKIIVPIIYQGQVIGIIDSTHPQKGFFQLKHISILTTIASLCANKIVKVKAEEEARKSELKLAEYHKKTAEFKLMALRSQMNPHFIFNSLSSIQHLITRNERRTALEYLSTFSRLLRQILESSLNSQILLSEEIGILRNYLSMESLRFENKFDYSIEIDKGIDVHDIEIPALLIQPYVENALLHGLLTKPERGYLTIRFENKENYIQCLIEDNGIGRAAAAEIKRRKPIGHTSVGMHLSEERLELINGGKEEQVLVKITDLGTPQEPLGTRVEICIPGNSY